MANSLTSVPANQRIALLKSGMRSFLTNIKLPPTPETRWLIEAVCLHGAPEQLAPGSPTLDQTSYFLVSTLYGIEVQLNKDKDQWVQSMKN